MAWLTDYYSAEGDDGEVDHSVERLWGEIESDAASVLRRVPTVISRSTATRWADSCRWCASTTHGSQPCVSASRNSGRVSPRR